MVFKLDLQSDDMELPMLGQCFKPQKFYRLSQGTGFEPNEFTYGGMLSAVDGFEGVCGCFDWELGSCVHGVLICGRGAARGCCCSSI
ncbi:hypothetical protein Droror1_Dr00014305 [Drosera rotundifolia]